MTAAVRTKGLSQGYGDLPVLRNLDFDVESGDFFIIIGPNLTTVVESAWNAINVGEDDTIWDVIEKLEAFQEAVEGLGANILIGTSYVPDVLGPGEDAVEIGPFPDLNSGSLPQPVYIIPVNLDVGRGPSYQLSLLGNC